MAKANYTKPVSQLDLERRQKDGHAPGSVLDPGSNPELSTNGYVGVDAVYQNAANDTEKPRQADKGPEAKVFSEFLDEDAEFPELSNEDGDDEQEAPAPVTPPSGSNS